MNRVSRDHSLSTCFYPVREVVYLVGHSSCRLSACLIEDLSPDWSWMVRSPSLPTPPCARRQPPCHARDTMRYIHTSSSYSDKGREAGYGDGTGRDMGSLKNGYGPGLERGGCHALNTTRRNKTSLSTSPPTKAPLRQTPPSRCCCEIVVDPSPPPSPPLPPPPPALCHPRGHGQSRVSSPLRPSRPFPDPQLVARPLALSPGPA